MTRIQIGGGFNAVDCWTFCYFYLSMGCYFLILQGFLCFWHRDGRFEGLCPLRFFLHVLVKSFLRLFLTPLIRMSIMLHDVVQNISWKVTGLS